MLAGFRRWSLSALNRSCSAILSGNILSHTGRMNPKTPKTEVATAPPTFQSKGVEIFAAGRYRDKHYTIRDLDAMVRNFILLGPRGKKLLQPPNVIGHEDDQEFLDRTDLPAAGWPKRVWRKGSKLFADFGEMPAEVAHAINTRAYRKVSAEIYDDFVDDQGNHYGKALRRVAILGAEIPQVKSLADIPYATPEYDADQDSPEDLKRLDAYECEPGIWRAFCERVPVRRFSEEYRLGRYQCPRCKGPNAFNGLPGTGTTFRGSGTCMDCHYGFSIVGSGLKPIGDGPLVRRDDKLKEPAAWKFTEWKQVRSDDGTFRIRSEGGRVLTGDRARAILAKQNKQPSPPVSQKPARSGNKTTNLPKKGTAAIRNLLQKAQQQITTSYDSLLSTKGGESIEPAHPQSVRTEARRAIQSVRSELEKAAAQNPSQSEKIERVTQRIDALENNRRLMQRLRASRRLEEQQRRMPIIRRIKLAFQSLLNNATSFAEWEPYQNPKTKQQGAKSSGGRVLYGPAAQKVLAAQSQPKVEAAKPATPSEDSFAVLDRNPELIGSVNAHESYRWLQKKKGLKPLAALGELAEANGQELHHFLQDKARRLWSEDKNNPHKGDRIYQLGGRVFYADNDDIVTAITSNDADGVILALRSSVPKMDNPRVASELRRAMTAKPATPSPQQPVATATPAERLKKLDDTVSRVAKEVADGGVWDQAAIDAVINDIEKSRQGIDVLQAMGYRMPAKITHPRAMREVRRIVDQQIGAVSTNKPIHAPIDVKNAPKIPAASSLKITPAPVPAVAVPDDLHRRGQTVRLVPHQTGFSPPPPKAPPPTRSVRMIATDDYVFRPAAIVAMRATPAGKELYRVMPLPGHTESLPKLVGVVDRNGETYIVTAPKQKPEDALRSIGEHLARLDADDPQEESAMDLMDPLIQEFWIRNKAEQKRRRTRKFSSFAERLHRIFRHCRRRLSFESFSWKKNKRGGGRHWEDPKTGKKYYGKAAKAKADADRAARRQAQRTPPPSDTPPPTVPPPSPPPTAAAASVSNAATPKKRKGVGKKIDEAGMKARGLLGRATAGLARREQAMRAEGMSGITGGYIKTVEKKRDNYQKIIARLEKRKAAGKLGAIGRTILKSMNEKMRATNRALEVTKTMQPKPNEMENQFRLRKANAVADALARNDARESLKWSRANRQTYGTGAGLAMDASRYVIDTLSSPVRNILNAVPLVRDIPYIQDTAVPTLGIAGKALPRFVAKKIKNNWRRLKRILRRITTTILSEQPLAKFSERAASLYAKHRIDCHRRGANPLPRPQVAAVLRYFDEQFRKGQAKQVIREKYRIFREAGLTFQRSQKTT